MKKFEVGSRIKIVKVEKSKKALKRFAAIYHEEPEHIFNYDVSVGCTGTVTSVFRRKLCVIFDGWIKREIPFYIDEVEAIEE